MAIFANHLRLVQMITKLSKKGVLTELPIAELHVVCCLLLVVCFHDVFQGTSGVDVSGVVFTVSLRQLTLMN